MSAAAIKERLSRRPFDPFRLVLPSGDSYEVRHPEMALLLRNGIYIAVPEVADELPLEANWCSLLHVAAIEPLSPSATPGNGAG